MLTIDNHEIWDLKKAIAEFITPRLVAFRACVVAGEMTCLPTWVAPAGDNMDEVQLRQTWADILEEMIKGFEYYAGYKSGDTWEAVEQQKQKSLALFYQYYDHLWD